MKKIVVACDGTNVTGHFGHCELFRFFDTENGAVLSEEAVPNPGHRPGFLPNFLGDRGAEVVICGGMGKGADEIFRARNIETITGASGDAREAVERYLRGELKTAGVICQHHHHDHHHGE